MLAMTFIFLRLIANFLCGLGEEVRLNEEFGNIAANFPRDSWDINVERCQNIEGLMLLLLRVYYIKGKKLLHLRLYYSPSQNLSLFFSCFELS